MAKLAGTFLKIATIFIIFLYLLSCLVPYLPSDKYWMIAMLGLIFPILFFIVLFIFFAWLLARSKWALLPLVALIISWQQIAVVTALNTNKKFTLEKETQTLRVLTWNLSSWGETTKLAPRGYHPAEQMVALIKSQQADVLCFQEFYDRMDKNESYSTMQAFKEAGYPYNYCAKSEFDPSKNKMGVVIFSKYPIVDSAKFIYGERDFAEHLIYADILFHDKKIRVFTTHLQSVRFNNDQYMTISKIKKPGEAGLKGSRTLLSKLKKAYQYRGAEANLLHEKISESPYPAIVCGDFNDVPNSYTYFTVRGNMQDAFLEQGNTFGRTFRYLSPTLRIDYILADKKLEVAQYNRVISTYSDHYPVMADFNFR